MVVAPRAVGSTCGLPEVVFGRATVVGVETGGEVLGGEGTVVGVFVVDGLTIAVVGGAADVVGARVEATEVGAALVTGGVVAGGTVVAGAVVAGADDAGIDTIGDSTVLVGAGAVVVDDSWAEAGDEKIWEVAERMRTATLRLAMSDRFPSVVVVGIQTFYVDVLLRTRSFAQDFTRLK